MVLLKKKSNKDIRVASADALKITKLCAVCSSEHCFAKYNTPELKLFSNSEISCFN